MVTTCTALSNTVLRRTAVAMPSGTAMRKVTSMDTRLSSTVLSMGVPIMLITSVLYWVE